MNRIDLYTTLISLVRLLKDCYSILYYRSILFLMGARIGKKSIFSGRVMFLRGKRAILNIGDHFVCFSSSYRNPLCRNICSSICVNNDAELVIGNNVGVSSVCIWSHKSINIGNNVAIGAGSILIDSDCHSINYLDRRDGNIDMNNKCSMDIIIEDDVLIGTSCVILKGVRIGARAVIGSGSIVTKNIPSDCIAAGNPCHIIRRMNE